ncbi:MAG: flavodoxin domain-containing protein [bacterium]|jgi:menaquinone-dependent protoporphyrinogen IX oxidase
MKSIVVYRSKTGFTKKYAEWIAEELGSDIFAVSQVNAAMLTAYDTVIYGGGLYAGGINGVKIITNNMAKLQGKKIVVFATGASPMREEVISEVRDRNFTLEQQEKIQFFYLRGGFNYTKLQFGDKILMQLLKWTLKRKKELTPDDKGMLAAYDTPVDFAKRQNIDDLIAYVKNKLQ